MLSCPAWSVRETKQPGKAQFIELFSTVEIAQGGCEIAVLSPFLQFYVFILSLWCPRRPVLAASDHQKRAYGLPRPLDRGFKGLGLGRPPHLPLEALLTL